MASTATLCWFQVSVGGAPCAEKIIMKLYDDKTPKTCANFRALCEGHDGAMVPDTTVPMSYKGSKFHRIIKKFMLQGGDFTNHNGTGGHSIYGEKFEDENFDVPCSRPGLLAMANAGPNTNGSQFFLTTVATPHLNGKHVVFGQVVRGMSVVRELENTPTAVQDAPIADCVIVDCGSMAEADLPDVAVAEDGDRFEDYPEDNADSLGDKELLEAGESIRTIGNDYFKKAEFLKATGKYAKAMRYLEEVQDTSAVHQQLKDKKVACNNNSAQCFIQLAKWSEAKLAAGAALQVDPTNTKALYRRGLAYTQTRDFDEASADFQRVLELDAGNVDAAAKLQECKAAEKAEKQRQAAKYKKMFD